MKKLVVLFSVVLILVLSGPVCAKGPKGHSIFDADVTPDVIFGSGNGNGSFTIVRKDGVEVALRAKLRFPSPSGVYNSNGDGTYSFAAGDACPGYGFAPWPLCLATPVWSIEWSINTDYDYSTGLHLSDFVYSLGLDADPGNRTEFTVFDNITPGLVAPFFDHAIGDNSTGNGAGLIAIDGDDYADLLANYNVAQNSWNYEFFNNLGTSLASFDPAVDGTYDVYLEVRDAVKGKKVADVRIQVIVGDG